MKNKCIIFLFCHSILLLAACTGGFENDNEIKGGFSDDKKEIDFQNPDAPFGPIQLGNSFKIGFVSFTHLRGPLTSSKNPMRHSV